MSRMTPRRKARKDSVKEEFASASGRGKLVTGKKAAKNAPPVPVSLSVSPSAPVADRPAAQKKTAPSADFWAERQNSLKTVGEACDLFREMYGLARGFGPEDQSPDKHEAIHVMTGLAISLPDEQRVGELDWILNRGYHDRDDARFADGKTPGDRPASLSFAINSAIGVRNDDMDWMKGKLDLGYLVSSYLTPEFRKLQTLSVSITRKEMRDLWDIGRRLDERIKKATGKYFYEMGNDEVLALPFSLVDVSKEVGRAKQRHMLPQNFAVEMASTAEMQRRAAELGRAPVPNLALESWHRKHRAKSRFGK